MRCRLEALEYQGRAEEHRQDPDGLQPEAEGRGAEAVEGQEVRAPGPAAEEDARDPQEAPARAEVREDGEDEEAATELPHAALRRDHVSRQCAWPGGHREDALGVGRTASESEGIGP